MTLDIKLTNLSNVPQQGDFLLSVCAFCCLISNKIYSGIRQLCYTFYDACKCLLFFRYNEGLQSWSPNFSEFLPTCSQDCRSAHSFCCVLFPGVVPFMFSVEVSYVSSPLCFALWDSHSGWHWRICPPYTLPHGILRPGRRSFTPTCTVTMSMFRGESLFSFLLHS